MAGNADFARWRAQQLQNQWQFAVGAAQNSQAQQMSRMNALSQIAAGQQQQQSQQAFEQQMLPQRAALDAQSQAFQSNLAGQNQQNLALLQGSLHAQQSSQDFGEQQTLQNLQNQQQMERDQAQRQAQIEGQQTVASYQDRLKQGMQDRAMFQNPLKDHMQMMEQAQKAGYSFTQGPGGQQEKVDDLKNKIQATSEAVANGTTSIGDALTPMKQLVGQLNSITPSQPPPKTVDQAVSEKLTWGWKDPQTGQVKPGTEDTPFTLDKDGNVMVPRGYKPPEPGEVDDNGELVPAKVAGQRIKNKAELVKLKTAGMDWAAKKVESEAKGNPFYGVDPATGMPIPGYREQRLQYWNQIHQELNGGHPNMAPGEAPGEAVAQPQPLPSEAAAGIGTAPPSQPPGQQMQPGQIQTPPPPAPQQAGQIPQPGYSGWLDPRTGLTTARETGALPGQPAPAKAGPPSAGSFPAQGQPAPQGAGPHPGSFQHEPPAQSAQQIQHQAVQHYIEISKSMPPEWKAKEQAYAQAGQHGAAVAVAGMYAMMAQYGPDATRWPPGAIEAAKAFRREAPDV